MSRKKTPPDPAVRDYLSKIGAKGGKKSRGGGRPRIPDDQLTPEQRKRRERYEASKKPKP